MSMRSIFGAFYVAFGTLFVGINSYMLWTGAQLVGSSQNEKTALGIFGAGLAFYLAAQTVTMHEFFRKVRLFWLIPIKMPHISSVLLWLLFLGVNLITGLGTIGHARNASIAQSKQQAKTVNNADEDRQRYKNDLAKLPPARPVDAVEAEIGKLRLTKAYINADSCADPKTRDQRSTCQQIQALKAEQAVAQQRAQLEAKLEEKGEVVTEAGPVVEAAAETQVAGVYRALLVLGVVKDDAAKASSVKDDLNTLISAMWPVALEAGAAYSWHQGFFLLGLSMAAGRRRRGDDDAADAETANDNDKPATGKLRAIAARAHNPTPPATAEQLRRDRQLVEWFFSNRTRPVPGGSMTEDQWYDLYRDQCTRCGATPVHVDWMRRIAIEHGVKVQVAGDKWIYFGVLPANEAVA